MTQGPQIPSPWIASSEDRQERFSTKEALRTYLSQVKTARAGNLSVEQDLGPEVGWRRFLGAKRHLLPHFAIEWTGDFASLIFLDAAWSEFRATDPEHPVSPSEQVRRQIAHGELQAHPVDECLDKERAFAAVEEYLVNDKRPNWMAYRYVK